MSDKKQSDFSRKEFVTSMGILAATPIAMKLENLKSFADGLDSTSKMPVIFAGHGNPMNAIQHNSFTEGWETSVQDIPKPKAILCISAHWETRGTKVTAMDMPQTIHDFGGFPQALFDVQYPCPGAPELAKDVKEMVKKTEVGLDHQWGLDHGTWSVLVKMYPNADIPVFQLSLDYMQAPQYHYELAKELASLRRKGVLIIGSGNVVHNLRMADLRDGATPYDWAVEFDTLCRDLIQKGDHQSLIQYQKLGTAAQLSIPTPEHYLPLLYILALQEKDDQLHFFNEEMAFKSGSMRSLKFA